MPVSATVANLVPGYTYHYRLVSTSAAGTSYGPDQTFSTANPLNLGDINGDAMVDQSELDAVLANYWPYCPWLYMTNAVSLGGGVFEFSLTNATAWNFTVMASTNLVDWTNLPAPALPVYQFIDPEATNQPQRSYRLRWP